MYYFPNLEPVCCSMLTSNCCFLTCIQISQEGQVVWYSHLFKNFPQFIVIYTVKVFGLVNKTEVDFFFFWNSHAFLTIQWMLAVWSLAPLPFLNPDFWKAQTELCAHQRPEERCYHALSKTFGCMKWNKPDSSLSLSGERRRTSEDYSSRDDSSAQ